MKKSEISIIMPCYNVERYVRTAVESVLRQDVPVQLIVVDDGSDDNTLEVLASYSDDITILQSDHLGVAHARNKASELVRNRYVLLLDADDALAPNGLNYLLNRMKQDRNQVVHGYFSSWDISMKKRLHVHKVVSLHKYPLSLLSMRNISPPGAILFPSDAFEKVGNFDQAVAGCEDWDFNIRLARAGYRFTRVRKNVFYYRRVPFSASNQARKMLESGLEVLRRCCNGDVRVKDDLYPEGYPAYEMEKRQFYYHAHCLASSLFSPDNEACRDIILSIKIPEVPNWVQFGDIFRRAVWWNSLVIEGERTRIIRDAQYRCIVALTGLIDKQDWNKEMVNGILFPDIIQLLRRPGPRKALRMFKEWRIARQISSLADI